MFSGDREQLYEMLKEMGMPHVKVEIFNDKYDRDNSPIGSISDTFELLMNSLIGDILLSGRDEAGLFLSHLEHDLGNLVMLAGNIMSDEERMKNIKERLKNLKDSATPIPEVWLDAFEEDSENG